ncbi:MAG: beta-propeller fold lactonase family protein [Oxalobacter sp.]|nr:beta-propeller fold lactonase family protein [Oxalobacter sp.]
MADYKKVASGLLVSLLGLCLMGQVQAAGKKARTQHVAAKKVQQPQLETVAPEASEEAQGVQVPGQVKQQVPGYYRMMVGGFEVTALFDGTFDFHPEKLRNMDPAQVNKILMHHYGQNVKIQSPINAYLIHTGDHLVLIDTGAGKLFGKTQQGHIIENLKAAGYQPTGTHPRNFTLSPDGRFLLCACRDDNRIEIYRIAPDSGLLTLTDRTIETGAPVCIQWL